MIRLVSGLITTLRNLIYLDKMTNTKHGGRRQGAGAPKKLDKLVPFSLLLKPTVKARFDKLNNKQKKEAREHARAAICKVLNISGI